MKTTYSILSLVAGLMCFTTGVAQTEGLGNGSQRTATTQTVQEQPIEAPSSQNRMAAAELINYQAVARNAGGDLITNTGVTVAFEILDGAGGPVVFSESQNPTTDANGVFSVQLGSVNALDAVNWLDIEPWLRVSLNGTNVGETAMASVPTALHSRESSQVLLFGSGTTNPDKMIVQHSPGFPGWGIAYNDVSDDVEFRAGGTTNMAIDLATGNAITDGYVEINQTTSSPAPNRIYGNSMPIAYGSIDSLGGISTGYGIASVNNSATGVYEITLSLDSNPANTVVSITPFTIGFGIPEIAGYETIDANNFIIRIQDNNGTARDSAFTFVVYGE